MSNRCASVVGIMALAAALVLGGCCSARYTSSLKPSGDKGLQYGAVRFNMSVFNYEKPGVEPLPQAIDEKARALYPKVFNNDWASLPVQIDVKRSYDATDAGMRRFISLTCTLGTVPLSCTYRHGFTVHTSVLDSLGNSLAEKDSSFEIDVVEWSSFWPWGLLPVTGPSDLPRDTFLGKLSSSGEATTAKINDHAAACVAEAVARSLKSADQSRLAAAFRERRSRVQKITVDGRPCQAILTMTPASKPKRGSTFTLIVYQGVPNQGVKALDEAVVALYDDSGSWQPVTGYLRHARTLTSVSAVMEKGVPVRVEVRTPDTPPLEDFIDTPDLSGADRADLLRWSNAQLREAGKTSRDTELSGKSAEALLAMATRIGGSVLFLNEQADRAEERARNLRTKGEGDPAPDEELSLLLRQRIEVLKPILTTIREAAAKKGKE
jgi:hypothetical protein